MATRKKARRARSRKPRPEAAQGVVASESTLEGASKSQRLAAAREAREARSKPREGRSRRTPPGRAGAGAIVATTLGERPRAPWYPLPLSELLIVVGAIGAVIGLRRGVSHGGPPLFAGLAAVALGTIEVTVREHRGGYRSHTTILALLPVVAFHTAGVLVITAFTRLQPLMNVGLLVIDLALFALMFKVMRARFIEARHARALGGP